MRRLVDVYMLVLNDLETVVITSRTFHYAFFFFNDTATTEIYTLSLHDALPICTSSLRRAHGSGRTGSHTSATSRDRTAWRSEEHTSELQSRLHLVCRLLLEKKKITKLQCRQQLVLSLFLSTTAVVTE